MPFKSEAQRSFMYAKHPKIAKEWAEKYGPGENLPKHVKEKKPKSPWLDMKKSEDKKGEGE